VAGPSVLGAVEAALVTHFAQAPQRASVSFVGVEPIEVLRFEPIPDERAFVSLGMARVPMTGAAETQQRTDGPRAELVLHLRDSHDTYREVWRRVALLAAAPTVEGVVYRPGMTVDLGEPLAAGSACAGVVVTEFPLGPIGTPAGPVEVLQIVPATSTELAWSRVRGSAALREIWNRRRVDLLDLGRRPVPLD
jgi:hypothetical protein